MARSGVNGAVLGAAPNIGYVRETNRRGVSSGIDGFGMSVGASAVAVPLPDNSTALFLWVSASAREPAVGIGTC